MSFNYDELKAKQDSGNHWSSYSDLFMVLSFVFLLLYVVANLKEGTTSIQKHIEYQKLAQEAADLKEQIKVYNTLKENYLETGADNKEKQLYGQLMDKLYLLKEEAKEEKETLQKQAAENAEKEQVLNKYQQLIRNIVNANMMAQARIKKRDGIIEEKKTKIQDLKEDMKEKKEIIAQGETKIAKMDSQLKEKIKQLKWSYKKNKISKTKMQKAIAALKTKTKEKINNLKTNNEVLSKELIYAKDNIEKINSQLEVAKNTIEIKDQEASQLASKLSKTADQYTKQINNLKQEYEEQMQEEQERFNEIMQKQKLSQKAKEQKEKEFRKLAEKKQQELDQKLSKMNSKLVDVNTQLNAAQTNLNRKEKEKEKLLSKLQNVSENYQNQINQLKEDHESKMEKEREAFEDMINRQKLSAKAKEQKLAQFKQLMKKRNNSLNRKVSVLKNKMVSANQRLKKAMDKANARKKLADRIIKNFHKAGIKANVDPNTGDVFLSFGKHYFDTGRANLKNEMKNILKKFIPIYSQSLFEDEKVAQKLSSVEIIGFASPTYKGKYVDPKSLKPKDKKAVSYNLDLSYNRAKSIFNYIFDTKKLNYQHQKDLLSLVKVTGRSFLAEGAKGLDVKSGLTQKEYCKKFDCKKSQKVFIKFNLQD